MICSICQYANRDTANFCLNCGSRLAVVCARCETKLPVSANFCDNCGEQVRDQPVDIPHPPIGESSPDSLSSETATVHSTGINKQGESALSKYIPEELAEKLKTARFDGQMVGERRVVTILFCDVKGSTAAAEHLDPEEWTEVINQAFEFMIKPVYKYEGTVARLMGDAILAFFGAPISHEDDPQRAAMAGLDIVSGMQPLRQQVKQQYGIDFDVRVGINTGLVVVGAVGSDLRMEYSALGDAVNVAARMEQAAQPGTILISGDTHRLIEPYFEFEELGELEVKGKEDPVPSFRIINRRYDSERFAGIGGVRADLVGRDDELAQFEEVLAQAREGVGRIVSVVGDAGLGKSRLIDESLTGWRSQPDTSTYQVECLSYEHNQAYSLIKRLFLRLMDIRAENDAQVQQKKLELFVGEQGTGKQPAAKRVLQTLLGLELEPGMDPLEGETFKRELYQQTEDVLARLISKQPTVLVFEDIHWSDLVTIELLQHLLPLVEDLPLVMVFSFRPDRRAPSWELKQAADLDYYHRYSEIRLQVLSDEDCEALINCLLRDPDIPVPLLNQIIERANGNPFYIEEVLRTLIDNQTLVSKEEQTAAGPRLFWYASAQAVKLNIPESLKSLLTARIDLLEEDTRQTLQNASVIGRRFHQRVLLEISNGSEDSVSKTNQQLKNLLRLEIIDEAARKPEVEYIFRNPMVQETIYRSVLRKRRAELHLCAAQALERLYPQRLGALAPLLGFHFTRGGDLKKALSYYTAAGDDAFRLYANALAAAHYEAALEQAKTFQEGALDELLYLYLQAGRALELESRFQEAADLYEDELALGRELESPQLELQALVSLGTVYSMASDQADPAKAESLSKQALQLAERLDDKDSQARILWNLMNIYRLELRPEEGIAAGKKGLALALESGNDEISAYIYNDLSYVYLGKLDTQNANQVIDQAVKRWRELNNQPMLVDSLTSSTSITIYLGKYEEAIAASDEATRISHSINNPWGIGFSRMYIGYVYEDRGEISRALSDYETTYKMGVESGFHIGEVWGQVRLAHLYIELNDFEKASEYIDRVRAQASNYSGLQGMFASISMLEQAAMYIARGDTQKARFTFDEAELDDAKTYIYSQDYVYEVEARLLLASEEYQEAQQLCMERIKHLEALNNKSFLHQMYLSLGITHLELGEFEQAESALNTAYEIADRLGARWRLWQILAARAELAELQGTGDKAQELRAKAVEYIEAISAEIEQSDLRESFLNRDNVAKLVGQVG